MEESRRQSRGKPPELFGGFLHCYYKGIYGTRPVIRELQNILVWLHFGFEKPPSRDTVDRFLTDREHVVDEVFDHLVEQAAYRACLTPHTASIRLTSPQSDTTMMRRGKALKISLRLSD